MWQSLGSARVRPVILISCTVEFVRCSGRHSFLIKTHVGSGTRFVAFFGTSQGGCHLKLETTVITSKFCIVSGVPFLVEGQKLGRSAKYGGGALKSQIPRSRAQASSRAPPWLSAFDFSLVLRHLGGSLSRRKVGSKSFFFIARVA